MPEEKRSKRPKKPLGLKAKTPDSEKLRPLDELPEYAPPPAGDQVTAAFMVEKKPKEYFGTPRKEDAVRAVRKIIRMLRYQGEEIIYDEEAVKSLAGLVEILEEGKNGKK